MRALCAVSIGLGACSESAEPCACRGDETCVEEVCVPWYEAPLSVDFDLETDGRAITCTVVEGGFPRDRVDSLRFSFGDGVAGYGERISHEYAAGGVYPVELVVRLEGYRELRASRLAVVSDGAAPSSRVVLTLEEVPDYLNGSIPYQSDNFTPLDPSDDYQADFHLLVPQRGFEVDVILLEAPGAEVDVDSLVLTADRALGGGAVPAGENLADRLVFERGATDRVAHGVWTVADGEAFPVGSVTLALAATDAAGGDHAHTLGFEVAELIPELDPLDRPMTWLLRFDMDLFTIARTDAGGISAVDGADGEPDFSQELAAIGARGNESGEGAATVRGRDQVGANAIYQRWIVDELLAEVRRYYLIAPDGTARDRIDMQFVALGDDGAPAPGDFSPDGDFSMMRFGGHLGSSFGRSLFAPHNEGRVDDTTPGLGVATSTIIGALATTAFVAEELFPISPEIGTPVGEHPYDAIVLADDFDRYAPDNDPEINARYDDLAGIARQLAQAIGAVTAHEMGHAMGLVPNDAPPAGYFGNRGDVDFINPDRTDSHHVDFPFLNLMQAGGNPLAILSEALERVETPQEYGVVDLVRLLALENRLSPYARAYFQRGLTYAAFDTP